MWRAYCWLVCLLASLAGLYFTYTRGSWVAGIAGLACAVYMNRRRFLPIVAPAAVAAMVLAVFVLGLGDDQFAKERVENDNTLGSRVGTAVTVLRVWRDHPLFGVGFFHFKGVREQYVAPVEAPFLGTDYSSASSGTTPFTTSTWDHWPKMACLALCFSLPSLLSGWPRE